MIGIPCLLQTSVKDSVDGERVSINLPVLIKVEVSVNSFRLSSGLTE